MSVLDTKRYSPNILDTQFEKTTSTTKTVTPKKRSPAEIIQDTIKSLQNQSKDTTDFINQSEATQVQEQSPNPLDDYFNSNKPSASPNEISDTPGILLSQNSSGFQRYADSIRKNSNKELVLSENRTHNLCIMAATSPEVQTTLAKLSYSKTDLKNAEEMLKALANQAVKENNISSSSLDVKFYNSASMYENQLYSTVFGIPTSKADMKAFYDNENDTIWINLDKSTGSTQDIIATFANELSHYVDDIKGTEFTPARQKVSTIHERKADNLLVEFMGEDTRSADQIKTFRQQALFLDLDNRNLAAAAVKEPQPAIPLLAVVALGMALGALSDYGFQVFDNYVFDDKPLKESLGDVDKASIGISAGLGAVGGAGTSALKNGIIIGGKRIIQIHRHTLSMKVLKNSGYSNKIAGQLRNTPLLHINWGKDGHYILRRIIKK